MGRLGDTFTLKRYFRKCDSEFSHRVSYLIKSVLIRFYFFCGLKRFSPNSIPGFAPGPLFCFFHMDLFASTDGPRTLALTNTVCPEFGLPTVRRGALPGRVPNAPAWQAPARLTHSWIAGKIYIHLERELCALNDGHEWEGGQRQGLKESQREKNGEISAVPP